MPRVVPNGNQQQPSIDKKLEESPDQWTKCFSYVYSTLVIVHTVFQCCIRSRYASDSLRGDREFVLKAVALDGLALKYTTVELQADYEVVLTAVMQNGYALQYAIADYRRERAIVLAAVTQCGGALCLAHPKRAEDLEIALAAIAEDVQVLDSIPENIIPHQDLQNIAHNTTNHYIITISMLSGRRSHLVFSGDTTTKAVKIKGSKKLQINEPWWNLELVFGDVVLSESLSI
eukprot:5799047-Amphidinium_carterae.1